jgi:putative endonuclease
MAQHNELGKTGEKIAQKYLQNKGYKILETNWRFGKAEIDIIAQINNILVVVEVKTRTSDHYGKPEVFVKNKKIKLLLEAINQYVAQKNIDVEIRFDIISIIKNQYQENIEHLENAYYWY